jgi:hypothetical protein
LTHAREFKEICDLKRFYRIQEVLSNSVLNLKGNSVFAAKKQTKMGGKFMGKIIPLDYKWESINPLKEVLTVEKLRSFEGMGHLSDAEAQEIVYSIRTFSNIVYEFLKEKNSKNEDNNQKLAA